MPRPAPWIALAALLACVAGAEAAPLEWLPVDSPLYRELELLRTEGLLDTTVSLETRPLARADAAALVAFVLAHHPEASGHPGVARLHRELSRELVDLGLPAAA